MRPVRLRRARRALASGIVAMLLLVGFAWLAVAAGAHAAEPGQAEDLDDLLDVFDEPIAGEEDVETAEPEAPEARRVRIGGSVALDSAFAFDDDLPDEFRPLAKLRTEGRLHVDATLPYEWKAKLGGRAWWDAAYAIQGRGDFAQPVLDAYETELEFWESWIGGPLGENVHLRAGRQIVGLGTSETFRVVDLLFPVDDREPGRADLDDLKLPLAIARADWSVRPGLDLIGIAFLERRFSELPPAGSPWLPDGTPDFRVERPGHSLSESEWALAARGRAKGVDLSLVGAYFYRDAPSFRVDPAAAGGLSLAHDRLGMVGATAVGAAGDFVWRAEAAGFHGLEFANDPGERHDRVDVLLGVDWFGLSGSAIALDVVQRFTLGAPAAVERAPDFARRTRAEWALRWRHDLLRDRLHLTLVGVSLGWALEDGAVLRLQADFDWSDALRLTAGVLLYASGDLPPQSALGRNDRIFLGASFSF